MKNFQPIRLFLAGHEGMVGKALLKSLESSGHYQVIVAQRSDLDLTNQHDVITFFKQHQFDEVYIAAAKVGGIFANNSYPADFIFQNIMIQTNIIHAAHLSNINKLLFLGSSCIYPVHATQPIQESSLLSGPLEITNQAYAIAKISGIEMCHSYNKQYSRDYRCMMPTNLYGPNDNFHNENSHVIPGLISKFYKAVHTNQSEIIVWGTGTPLREFLHVEDLANACIFMMQLPKEAFFNALDTTMPHINIGSGEEISIAELVMMLIEISGFTGNIIYDSSKPDGSPRKLLDSSAMGELGWSPKKILKLGLTDTYNWFASNQHLISTKD